MNDSGNVTPLLTPANRRRFPPYCPPVECSACALLALCRMAGLGVDETRLAEVVGRKRPVARGAEVHRRERRSVIAVRSGALKSEMPRPGGEAQIVAFHLPGELVALAAADEEGEPEVRTVALMPSEICELPVSDLPGFAPEEAARFHLRLAQDATAALLAAQRTLAWTRGEGAEARLAGFLLDIAARFASRDLPAQAFRLPMPRRDIANFLGLAEETVCRLFRRFHGRGWIAVSGKRIVLRDPARLRTVAAGTAADAGTSRRA